MLFSIIISTIKGRELAYADLIKSIAENTRGFEIVTHDDTLGKSIPIAEAWNRCAERATGEYLIFLNDDMLVTKDWAENQKNMWETLPNIGSLAFKVLDDQGNVQSRGHSFDGLNIYIPSETAGRVDYSDHPFTTKRNWQKVGGFTTHGQMYYEDADFGLKLQSMGLPTYYNANAVLIHKTIGLRVGNEEDKKRRRYNEDVIQQKSKKSFYKSWEKYLTSRNSRGV